ncbi:hypothetical protein [Paenarthrobacter ureafaciens]|uniref:hypothetical protein n=1 Tax=Paenarthrobacter ureafaciens TaxID=37931 RepID=UPI001FB35688|nr:hypothetical protein [Paenarthrobacter ureafaciens]UOD82482.1 hypothetical protein MQZ73_06395 [Paenarthrobacter ureafaciens]WNZ02181.1 hypothetical protein PVT25_10935 [Paenarthrobacter ureafaciens]
MSAHAESRKPNPPGTMAWATADPLRAVLALIAIITVLTGVVEMPFGGPLLQLLGADSTPETRQLFGTVGMFMVVVGGLLLHTLLSTVPSPEVVLWSGVQKTGAFGAVGIGVLNGVFSPLALLVAFFDLATAVLLFIYWRRLGAAAPAGLTP